jgi:predicted nuclease of predicted toxin-antitoxin system
MDEHIPQPITNGLLIRDVDVLTVQEDNRRNTDDNLLLDRATELNRVMVSFDEDMLRHATEHQQENKHFSGLVFAHPTQITIGECVRDLELIAKSGEPADLAEQVIYLPL